MATTVANLYSLFDGLPSGAWVAISELDHEVVAFGPDAQLVLSEARSKGIAQPLITRVPDPSTSLLVL